LTTSSMVEVDGQSFSREQSQLPAWRVVLREQLRVTGLALRGPIYVTVALALVATLLIAIRVAKRGTTIDVGIEPSAIFGLIGAVLPVVVWAKDDRFGPAFLWTLPVDRRQHALLKVFSGWLWLMAGIALSMLWLLALTLLSGGRIFAPEVLHVAAGHVNAFNAIDVNSLTTATWSPGVAIAFVPVAAATATYLLISALWLGTRYPFRWLIGIGLCVAMLVVASEFAHHLGIAWLAAAPERGFRLLVESRYGLDALLTARTASLDTGVALPTGQEIQVWREVPRMADWGGATVLWTSIGSIGLWMAASRHGEQRSH
jgi:hypothetical protein